LKKFISKILSGKFFQSFLSDFFLLPSLDAKRGVGGELKKDFLASQPPLTSVFAGHSPDLFRGRIYLLLLQVVPFPFDRGKG
jgi:hypothetical protein